jgi:predicted RNase H-like nuclease (RuvC/YqgF family)
MSYKLQMKRLVLEAMDDPKQLNKVFNTLIKNNEALREQLRFRNEMIHLHESDDNNNIKSLQSVIKEYEEKCRNLEKENYDLYHDNEKLNEEIEKWKKAFNELDEHNQQVNLKCSVLKGKEYRNEELQEENEKLKKIIENQSVLIESLRK